MTDQAAPRQTEPIDLFVTTRWTVVLAAGSQSTPAAADALQELCRIYWLPLYAFVRRQGRSREDAEDLTQAFLARLLEHHGLDRLDSEKGRFRAFLLASLKHFLANDWDKLNAQKRGGGIPHLSLDWPSGDAFYQVTPVDHLSPDKLFDRAWGITLLDRVILRLREEHATEGKAESFDRLKDFLTQEKGTISYETAGDSLGLSAGAARVAVHRLRKRYRELLRAEIAQTLSDPRQVDEEMRALFQAFAQ